MFTAIQIENKLKNEELNSLYLFFGEETYLIENSVKKIKSKFGELVKGINYIELDDTNIDSLISELETPAFGFAQKLIIVKDANLFSKETKKKSVKDNGFTSKINEYLKENMSIINSGVILVFIEQEAEKNELFNTIEANGIVCNFEVLKPLELEKRIRAICNAYGTNIASDTTKYFIECVGTNMQDIINELRKLIEFAGKGGTIQKDAIVLLTIKQIDSVIFDLTDNLGKKDIANALQVLKNLIYMKEPVQKILITLYNHFKKLYIVTVANRLGKDALVSLNLKPNQTFLVGKYKTQAKYFSESELRRILQKLIDLDYNYKIGNIDLDIGLQSILCAYCSK